MVNTVSSGKNPGRRRFLEYLSVICAKRNFKSSTFIWRKFSVKVFLIRGGWSTRVHHAKTRGTAVVLRRFLEYLCVISAKSNFKSSSTFIWENFWSETSLVSLGVKSVRSLIRVTRILVHIHWGRFFEPVLNTSERKMEGKPAYNANQWTNCIRKTSSTINGLITSPCWEKCYKF